MTLVLDGHSRLQYSILTVLVMYFFNVIESIFGTVEIFLNKNFVNVKKNRFGSFLKMCNYWNVPLILD